MEPFPILHALWASRSSQQQPQQQGKAAGADRARAKADAVETRLDRALLTMHAMWTLLHDRLGVTDEELAQRVVDLDLSDGILDGKVRRPPLECGSCHRTIPSRFPRCLYCGAEVTLDPFA